MPIATDYICRSKTCRSGGEKISLHGPWPIARIQAVIDSEDYVSDEVGRNALRKRKAEGRVFALVPLPNQGKLKVEGMRVQLYCPKCRVVWDEDTPCGGVGPSFEKDMNLVAGAMLIGHQPCPSCGTPRVSCNSLEVPCPGCGQIMERTDRVFKYND
jgi:hypothetical protein